MVCIFLDSRSSRRRADISTHTHSHAHRSAKVLNPHGLDCRPSLVHAAVKLRRAGQAKTGDTELSL
jgi:hypothetical protein